MKISDTVKITVAAALGAAISSTLFIANLPAAPTPGRHCFTTNDYGYAQENQATHMRRGAFMATITHVADPSVDQWQVCGHYSREG